MSDSTNEYNVVFQHTAKAGPYEGVMTWTAFASKEEFEAKKESFVGDGKQIVLRAGVSPEEAISCCGNTPMYVRMRVARHEATDPTTGEMDMGMYLSKLYAIHALESLGR